VAREKKKTDFHTEGARERIKPGSVHMSEEEGYILRGDDEFRKNILAWKGGRVVISRASETLGSKSRIGGKWSLRPEVLKVRENLLGPRDDAKKLASVEDGGEIRTVISGDREQLRSSFTWRDRT